MQWRKAVVAWNKNTYPDLPATVKQSEGVELEVALEPGWLHVRHRDSGGIASYPSGLVFRVTWEEPGPGRVHGWD